MHKLQIFHLNKKYLLSTCEHLRIQVQLAIQVAFHIFLAPLQLQLFPKFVQLQLQLVPKLAQLQLVMKFTQLQLHLAPNSPVRALVKGVAVMQDRER